MEVVKLYMQISCKGCGRLYKVVQLLTTTTTIYNPVGLRARVQPIYNL
jgi:hypothetical protein